MGRGEKQFSKAAEVGFEGLFAEGNSGKAEKVVLEVVEIPCNRLPIETGAGIADLVVEVPAGFDLKQWEGGDNLPIGVDGTRGDDIAGAIRTQEFEKCSVAQVLFEVGIFLQVFRVDLRDRQTVTTKVAGKLEEGDVFFAHRIDDADGPATRARKANDDAPRAAQLAMEWHYVGGGNIEVLLEEALKDVHWCFCARARAASQR